MRRGGQKVQKRRGEQESREDTCPRPALARRRPGLTSTRGPAQTRRPGAHATALQGWSTPAESWRSDPTMLRRLMGRVRHRHAQGDLPISKYTIRMQMRVADKYDKAKTSPEGVRCRLDIPADITGLVTDADSMRASHVGQVCAGIVRFSLQLSRLRDVAVYYHFAISTFPVEIVIKSSAFILEYLLQLPIKVVIRTMSSPNRSTFDIKDAFSSMNILNYTSVSSDYFPASSESSSFNSSENSKDNIIPPVFSSFYNNPYLKNVQPFYAKEFPISSPDPITPSAILTPFPVLPPSLLFNPRYFFIPKELLLPRKQIHSPSSSSTTLSNSSRNQTCDLVSPSSSVYTSTPP
ncbi:hypothetical protein Tco_0308926 [Tanacetum coccineum]